MLKTRFAPSPTGYLHIGGARTALFAWAWAKKHNGQFLLRIEDTDAERSQTAHSDAIIRALDWLGIVPDTPAVYQSHHLARHQEVITQLLAEDKAYRCYCSPQELEAMRQAQTQKGLPPRYDRRWRDSTQQPPADITPVVRFKMPLTGSTVFNDEIKGALTINNSELDDFVIARSDGKPTYNLAAVTDDIDMGITHIIRGDDHIMNTYRQWHIFAALTDTPPAFAHLPMILSAVTDDDGTVQTDDTGAVRYARMSKRNAAVDIDKYRQEGYLPAAMFNYLAKLSWSHKDLEVFDRDTFIRHLSLANITQSPARFDRDKLNWLNREYLRQLTPADIRQATGLSLNDDIITLLTERAVTLTDINAQAHYFETALDVPAALINQYLTADNTPALTALTKTLAQLPEWTQPTIAAAMKATAKEHQLPYKKIGMPVRILLTGETQTPDITQIAAALGQPETLTRLTAHLTNS